ncbi:MAG: TIGR03668 family PPOX class F420-dependent oxidoreductase [Thermoleophilia bacterium]
MDPAAMRARLEGARVARLATEWDDRGPHLVPICFALDGDALVSAVDGKPKRSRDLRRLRNVRAHPVATVLADHYDEDWGALWWVRVRGPARVLEPGGAAEARALTLLAAKYPQYRAAPPAGPVLRVVLEEWRGWAAVAGAA